MYEDKTVTCKDCGEDFIFTAGEQEFFAEKGFVNVPQRCKECRTARKGGNRQPREMHEAICDECGGVARIPFAPTGDRPIYCSACYAAKKDAE